MAETKEPAEFGKVRDLYKQGKHLDEVCELAGTNPIRAGKILKDAGILIPYERISAKTAADHLVQQKKIKDREEKLKSKTKPQEPKNEA